MSNLTIKKMKRFYKPLPHEIRAELIRNRRTQLAIARELGASRTMVAYVIKTYKRCKRHPDSSAQKIENYLENLLARSYRRAA